MDGAQFLKMVLQLIGHRRRQNRAAVLVALFPPNHDLSEIEIDNLHPQAQALEESQPRAIEQVCGNPVFAIQMDQYLSDLLRRKYGRQLFGFFSAPYRIKLRYLKLQNIAVKKQQGIKSLILRRSRHFSINGKVGEKGLDLLFAQLLGMTPVMKANESPNPVNVGFFSTNAVMPMTYSLPDDLQQYQFLNNVNVSFYLSLIYMPLSMGIHIANQLLNNMQFGIHDNIDPDISDTSGVYL